MTQTDSFLKSHTASKIEEEITFKICLSPNVRWEEGNRELSFPEHWAADLCIFILLFLLSATGGKRWRG